MEELKYVAIGCGDSSNGKIVENLAKGKLSPFSISAFSQFRECWREERGCQLIVLDDAFFIANFGRIKDFLLNEEDLREIPCIVVGKTITDELLSKMYSVGLSSSIDFNLEKSSVESKFNALIIRSERVRTCQKMLTAMRDADALTGINNKEAFYRYTAELVENNVTEEYAVTVWNFEKFKLINELFGNSTGNELLVLFAKCIKEFIGDNGTYGRLDGDLFGTCCPSKLIDEKIIKRVIDSFIGSVNLNYQFKIDVGIYLVKDRFLPVGQMCDRSLIAINTIKGDYSKSVAYYDDDIRKRLLYEQEMSMEMNYALENGQFDFFLQPVFSITKNAPVSAEALVRWIHPLKGVISPAKFIPFFEHNGFITKLDMFVWEKACAYIKERTDLGYDTLPISVNVSRKSLYNPNLIETFERLIAKYHIKNGQLKLEITESVYTDSSKKVISVLSHLKKMGIKIMMDDFGSGYSSLNMLKDLPVDVLKVDMNFLGGLADKNVNSSKAANIMTAVVNMARWLNIDVIVEGVETFGELNFLKSIGVTDIQGYYYSRPLPKPEFEEYVSERNFFKKEDEDYAIDSEDVDEVFNSVLFKKGYLSGILDGVIVAELTKEGKLIPIRVNDKYYDILKITPSRYFETNVDIFKAVSKESQKEFKKNILEVLKTNTSKNFIYKRRSEEGEKTIMATAFSLSDKGGANVVCGVIKDITKQEEEKELIKKKDGELYNYFKFLDSMYNTIPCAIVQYSLESPPKLLNQNKATKVILEYYDDKKKFNDLIKDAPFSAIAKEDKPYMNDLFKRAFDTRKPQQFEARAVTMDKKIKWIRGSLDIVASASGGEIFQLAFFDATESKLATRRNEITKFGPAIFDQYLEIVECDFVENSYVVLKEFGGVKNVCERQYGIDKFRFGCLNNDESEHKNCDAVDLTQIKERISKNYFKPVQSKVVWDGVTHWLRFLFFKVSADNYLICVADVSTEAELLNEILENIAAGILVFGINKNNTEIYFISNSASKLFDSLGINNNDILTSKLVQLIKEKESNKPFDINYETVRNGKSVFVSVGGIIKSAPFSEQICYCVINDVSESVEEGKHLAARDELYKILIEESDTILFDYDSVNDVMYYSRRVSSGYRKRAVLKDYMSFIKNGQAVEEQFKNEFFDRVKRCAGSEERGTFEIRADFIHNGYRWYRVKYVSIKDEDGKCYRIIGSVTDVNEERENVEKLKKRAAYDYLSGLYNRETFEELVNNLLKINNRGEKYSFFVIDVDFFKQINDKYGHPLGDKVLKALAADLKNIFPKDSIVGRFGGDEFVALYKNDDDGRLSAEETAAEIIERTHLISKIFDLSTEVSVSIGVSETPKDGDKFSLLFEKADKALYISKNKGKNRYSFYIR